jgi:L-cysteine desulfidase
LNISEYLKQEWKPALGCTEPASIAYAAASAAELAHGKAKAVHLICDPRIYKNCYAVGVPHSQRKTGINWAVALGCFLPDPSAKLECFRQIDDSILSQADRLLTDNAVRIEVDKKKSELFIDCRVEGQTGTGRAIIENEHTALVHREQNEKPIEVPVCRQNISTSIRKQLAEMSCDEMIHLAQSLTEKDRVRLQEGLALNMAIAKHGLSLFPQDFIQQTGKDSVGRYSNLVCAGVYARMLGEDFSVMTLVGSGNKGITCSVPLFAWGQEAGIKSQRLEEALALACLFTSKVTHHLGPLSAVCGSSNAAGIALAAGLVYANEGNSDQISLAINNMVGNVTGMICDGAKIGCGLKCMTAVDAAFRASSLALYGMGIPESDGIVGADGMASLANLGRIATLGMVSLDTEILKIMQEKLNS